MTVIAVTVVLLLVLFLGMGLWISVALFALGVSSLMLFKSIPVDRVFSQTIFSSSTSPELLALPLFILMSEILFRTKISERVMSGFAPWATWLPGRLLHVNVLASTMFSAVCGSSAATTATVGKITVQELKRRGYNQHAVIGSLAGAGTLGLLIPPSTVMIIYGVLANVSIVQLFIAGIVPGLLLAVLFMLAVVIWALIDKSIVPPQVERTTWRERIHALVDLLPTLVLIGGIMLSMYLGFATPTEAAAVGVAGALAISAWYRTLNVANLLDAMRGALLTSTMVGLIAVSAALVSVAMGYLGLPSYLAAQISALGLSKYELIAVLVVFYLVLGAPLEGFSMIVLTLPFVLPLVVGAGFDPVWFGIFLVIMIETAQISPPVGFNLSVIANISDQKIGTIAIAALPFLTMMIVLVAIITVWPGIVSWLPATMMGR